MGPVIGFRFQPRYRNIENEEVLSKKDTFSYSFENPFLAEQLRYQQRNLSSIMRRPSRDISDRASGKESRERRKLPIW